MIEQESESRKEWLKITFLVLQLIIVVKKALLRLLERNKIARDKSSSLQTRTRLGVAEGWSGVLLNDENLYYNNVYQ